MADIAISISIHAAPDRAVASPAVYGPLHLYFDKASGSYPDVTLFTGSLALATDLAAAINGVLEQHRAAKAECPECHGFGGHQIADDPRPVFVACSCQSEAAA